jgi:hypothetical protein
MLNPPIIGEQTAMATGSSRSAPTLTPALTLHLAPGQPFVMQGVRHREGRDERPGSPAPWLSARLGAN